ncbi:thioredoxin [Criblamydia sequanensis]|uniref:Thioredoxin n=1 Tax=Candidatus Criblamydia sequanensis CRIB-18 TaxID=1437425 RepID=A0A090CY03_9BACT|nr:thioredoxin [Criblamydia sequanensis]CDR33026.1 thioredoxin-related protein [Criblamydia sequanensis CRIB-18]
MANEIKHVNDENFDSEVKQGVVLVDFYADWCGPCRMIAPIIEKLAAKFQGKASVVKLDIEAAQSTTARYNVTSIPTLILFVNGEEKERIVGVRDENTLDQLLQKSL